MKDFVNRVCIDKYTKLNFCRKESNPGIFLFKPRPIKPPQLQAEQKAPLYIVLPYHNLCHNVGTYYGEILSDLFYFLTSRKSIVTHVGRR
jgi:hypothetical protein